MNILRMLILLAIPVAMSAQYPWECWDENLWADTSDSDPTEVCEFEMPDPVPPAREPDDTDLDSSTSLGDFRADPATDKYKSLNDQEELSELIQTYTPSEFDVAPALEPRPDPHTYRPPPAAEPTGGEAGEPGFVRD